MNDADTEAASGKGPSQSGQVTTDVVADAAAAVTDVESEATDIVNGMCEREWGRDGYAHKRAQTAMRVSGKDMTSVTMNKQIHKQWHQARGLTQALAGHEASALAVAAPTEVVRATQQ